MGKETGIPWCHHTFNSWRGCAKVSCGCAHCYAEAWSKRNPATLGKWGPNGTRVVAAESGWRAIHRWNLEARMAGERRRVFCCSLADVFERWDGPMVNAKGEPLYRVDLSRWRGCGGGLAWEPNPLIKIGLDRRPLTMDDVRARLFVQIEALTDLDFLLVTKRPENILSMVPDVWMAGFPRNVWILVSVENQATANERIPLLRRVPAVVRGLSMEPLLESVDLTRIRHRLGDESFEEFNALHHRDGLNKGRESFGVNWVIIGGESDQDGAKGRPFDVQWARQLMGQRRDAKVPVFIKQLGSLPYDSTKRISIDGPDSHAIQLDLRDSHGGDWDEWAADLRVREMPVVAEATA